ncbi:hypothetical protein GCM10009733_107220 [Nonomuraea maheshkhaliensis]|uniref:Uncharacterized protein n=1 Tax=Nonomuraea maheshkhaliensis TaxID=419590 RepID=A0ABN2HV08_9ACTN
MRRRVRDGTGFRQAPPERFLVALAVLSLLSDPGLLGLPELEVTGLTAEDAHVLLTSVTHVQIDQHVRDRFVAETRGNPLALLELPRDLAVTRMAGGYRVLDADTLPGRIEQSFLARIEDRLGPSRRRLRRA